MRFRWGLVNNLVNKITRKHLRFKAFKRREYYHIHLRAHKLIGKVGIYLSNEPLRTITHPNIHDIRANVLLVYRCERRL